jgi:hypothetical protein
MSSFNVGKNIETIKTCFQSFDHQGRIRAVLPCGTREKLPCTYNKRCCFFDSLYVLVRSVLTFSYWVVLAFLIEFHLITLFQFGVGGRL